MNKKPIYLQSNEAINNIRKWRGDVRRLRKFRAKGYCELCHAFFGVDNFILKGHHKKKPTSFATIEDANKDDNIVICCNECYRASILSKSTVKTTLIVPTLNELVGMTAIMPKIKPEWCDQIIVLDGNSTDGTLEYARLRGYDIYIQKEHGLWNGYRELFLSGIVTGDIVITFSPDGNSVPEGVPILAKTIELLGYDMVIASRYALGARGFDDTKITRLGNWLFTNLVNLLCRDKYTDALVMFRAYRREVVEKLGFTGEVPDIHRWAQKISGLSSWESPMSIRASRAKLRVAEIPVDEPPNLANKGGRRQLWIVHGFVILLQILYEGLFRRWDSRLDH